jgi:hypothetical protein
MINTNTTCLAFTSSGLARCLYYGLQAVLKLTAIISINVINRLLLVMGTAGDYKFDVRGSWWTLSGTYCG